MSDSFSPVCAPSFRIPGSDLLSCKNVIIIIITIIITNAIPIIIISIITIKWDVICYTLGDTPDSVPSAFFSPFVIPGSNSSSCRNGLFLLFTSCGNDHHRNSHHHFHRRLHHPHSCRHHFYYYYYQYHDHDLYHLYQHYYHIKSRGLTYHEHHVWLFLAWVCSTVQDPRFWYFIHDPRFL